MKRKTALSLAITLSLLLAHNVYAVELTADSSLSQFKDDGNGLMIYPDVVFDGENGDIEITGTVSGSNAIDCTGNGEPFYFGLQNEGVLDNVKSLTTDTIINYSGTMSVGDIIITKTGSDAYFMNYGKGANATINGNISVDSSGWVNNTEGAVMTLNGQNTTIGAELANDYGATLNINGDTYIDGSLWNVEGATTNIADGVTVTVEGGFANAFNVYRGGTVNAGGANIVVSGDFNTFSNTENMTIGSVSITGKMYASAFNSGNLTINNALNATMSNSGTLTYNGTEAIDGDLSNSSSGKIFATQDNLKVTGALQLSGTTSTLAKNETESLTTLTVGSTLKVNSKATLNIKDKIVTNGKLWVSSGGQVKTNILEVKDLVNSAVRETYPECQIEVNNLQFSNQFVNGDNTNKKQSGGTIIIHDSITYTGEEAGTIENYANIYFDGNTGKIGENIIVDNKVSKPSSDIEIIGLIAKNADGDKISNLTIEGTLNNSGIVAAETLNVANGMDAADSKGFNVDNLNILGSDTQDTNNFALQKDSYNFTSVGVGANASLTAAGSLGVSGAMALQDGASVETLAENGSITAGSVSVGAKGSVTTSALSVVKDEATSADGSLEVGKDALVRADSVSAETLTNAGSVGASVVQAGSVVNSGSIEAVDSLTANSFDNQGIYNGGVTIAGNVINSATFNTKTLQADTFTNTGSVQALGDAQGTVNAVITGTLKNDGCFISGAKLEAGTVLNGANGEMLTDNLQANTVTNDGSMSISETLNADELVNNGEIENNNKLNVQVGTITTGADSKLTATTVGATTLTNGGTLTAKDVSAKSLNAQSGTLTANDTLTVTDVVKVGESASVEAKNSGLSTNTITNEGTLTTAGAVVANGTLTNSGTLNTNNNDVKAETLTNSGKLETEGNVAATNTLTNSGTLTAKEVSAKSLNAQRGTLTATDTLTVTDVVKVGEDASVEAKNSGLSTNTITNDGTLTTAGAVVANGTLTNSGTLNTNNNDVTAGTLTNSGTLTGAKVEATTLVNNSNSAIKASGNVKINGELTNNGTLEAKGDVTATNGLSNNGTLEAKDVETTTLVNNSNSTIEASGNVKANGELTNKGTLTGVDVSATTLTNNSEIIARGGVSATDALTNKGTLKAEGNVNAETLTSGDNSKLTANNVTTTGDISVGNGATITVNGVMSSKGVLSVGTGSNVKANAVDVAAGVTLGDKAEAQVTALKAESLNIGDGGSVEASSLQLNDGQGTITLGGAVKNEDGTITAARLNVDGNIVAASLTSGEGSAVTAGNGNKIAISGTLKADGSVDADEITAKAITSGASSSITAGTVQADETMSIGGVVDAASVAAKTLVTGAGSSLTADTVNATDASISGKAEVTSAVTAAGDVVVGESASLATGSIDVDGTLALLKADAEESGAYVKVTDKLEAGALSVGDYGVIDAASVTATDGISLGDGASADVKEITVTDGSLVAGAGSAINADSVSVTKALSVGDNASVAVTNNLAAGALEVGASSNLSAVSVEVDEVISLGDNVTANVKDVTAQSLSAGQDSVITAQDVSAADIILGENTHMTADNVKDAQSVALNAEAGLTVNKALEAQNIELADNAYLHADDVQNAQSIVLENDAVMSAETIGMSDNSNVYANGGSVDAGTVIAENLTINTTGNANKQVVIDTLTGDGLTLNVNTLAQEQVVIDYYNGDTVAINGSGSGVTDNLGNDLTSIEAGMQDLADTLKITSDGVAKDIVAEQGSVLGEITGKVDANGALTVTGEKVNSFNQGVSEMASIALMTWRQENNDMNKRLGELRDSVGEHGVWVRMTRGESKYGKQNIKNQYNAYQLGYDEKLSVDKHWTVGAALTYTDANSSFSGGKGENKHKGIALYGSRLNDDGSFIDLIARYARLEHDFDVRGGAGKGDFDTNGYSVSAEYGKRFTGKSGLWLEPQVELTYGRVSSADYVTDKGVMVRQDDMDSLVGRLGFALGQNLAKGKGNVYLRASYLYDFEGETDAHFMNTTQQNRGFEQDLGGGWWEVGVGANINLSEATHLYFDVEKTYGGNVATPWQWNAGVRWSF